MTFDLPLPLGPTTDEKDCAQGRHTGKSQLGASPHLTLPLLLPDHTLWKGPTVCGPA